MIDKMYIALNIFNLYRTDKHDKTTQHMKWYGVGEHSVMKIIVRENERVVKNG